MALASQDSAGARSAIYLLSPETGEKRRLIPPRSEGLGDVTPVFSPDGRSLVFVRSMAGANLEIYLLRVSTDLWPEGEPKRLTFMDQQIWSPAWLPNGKELIFSSGSKMHDSILWRISTSGLGTPKPLPFSGEGMAFDPAISLKAHRLVYRLWSWDINIWRCQIPSGKEKPAPPSKLMPSTRVQEAAQYSPDGKAIAYVGWTSGSAEIWVCDVDGRNPLQLSHLGGHSPGILRWSPDGQKIVFGMSREGQSDLFAIPAQGGEITQFTHTPLNEGSPTYSSDGKWIYFDSDRSGVSQIWSMPAEGGAAVQLTWKGGSVPLESADGKTLFYLKPKDEDSDELWKVPAEGGEESRVLEEVFHANFAVKQQGIYYVSNPRENGTSILFYDFASRKTKHIATSRGVIEWGLTVPPDQQCILFTQMSNQTSDLMLVENFR